MMDNHLETIMMEECVNVVHALSDYLFKVDQHNAALPYQTALLSGAIVNVLIYWVREGMNISIQELDGIVQEFISGEMIQLT